MDTRPSNPVVAETLNLTDAAPFLIGTRCRDCQTLYFPKVVTCRNPDCAGKSVEQARIDARGRLYSYTVQRYRPPLLFGMEPWVPYALGLVDVAGGLRIMGILDLPTAEVEIGMPLRLTTLPLLASGEASTVTHAFGPDVEFPA
jgi:uncharacterized protein